MNNDFFTISFTIVILVLTSFLFGRYSKKDVVSTPRRDGEAETARKPDEETEERQHVNSKEEEQPNQTADYYYSTATSPLAPTNVSVVSSPPRDASVFDWNEQFQRLLDTPDSAAKHRAIAELFRNFGSISVTFGKIIVSELALAAGDKTVRPSAMGGTAGGLKYSYHGVLFKFAIDAYGIYGDTEQAAKAGLAELRGGARMSDVLRSSDIRVPLLAVLDYRGHRLVCESMLPISRSTLVYGSADGGRTVVNCDPEFADRMRTAGAQLNLAEHAIRRSDTRLVGPADIEGHRGTDGRYYLIDFARVYPPTADAGRSYLTKHLRPELVSRWPTALSSDAFSPFGGPENARIHNSEVESAFAALIGSNFRDAAAALDAEFDGDLASDEYDDERLASISTILHAHGVNVRYLGRIRAICTSANARTLLLVECVARAAKNELRRRMRDETPASVADEPYLRCGIRLLNQLLQPPSTSKIWNVTIVPRLQKAFAESEFDAAEVYQRMRPAVLVARVAQLSAITLSAKAMQQLVSAENPSTFVFVPADALELGVRLKRMPIVSFAEASALAIEALDAPSADQPQPLSDADSSHDAPAVVSFPPYADLSFCLVDPAFPLTRLPPAVVADLAPGPSRLLSLAIDSFESALSSASDSIRMRKAYVFFLCDAALRSRGDPALLERALKVSRDEPALVDHVTDVVERCLLADLMRSPVDALRLAPLLGSTEPSLAVARACGSAQRYDGAAAWRREQVSDRHVDTRRCLGGGRHLDVAAVLKDAPSLVSLCWAAPAPPITSLVLGDSLTTLDLDGTTVHLTQVPLEPPRSLRVLRLRGFGARPPVSIPAELDELLLDTAFWSATAPTTVLRSFSLINSPALWLKSIVSLDPSLAELRLVRTEAMLPSIADMLPKLELLDLSGNEAAKLPTDFRRLGRLEHLALRRVNGYRDETLALPPTLTSLDIRGSKVVVDVSDMSLKHLSMSQAPAPSSYSILQHLELRGEGVNDDLLQAIAAAAPPLRSFCLAAAPLVSDAGVRALVTAARSTLATLHLESCDLVSLVPAQAERLTDLSLAGCRQVRGDSLLAATRRLLRLLRLNVSSVQEADDVLLGTLPTSCPYLTELVVGGNKFSEAALAKAHDHFLVRSAASRSVSRRREKLASSSSSVRAAKLMADLNELVKSPLPLISALPLESNLLEWHANVRGAAGTPYAGGVFHLKLSFPPDYPSSPPSATVLSPQLPHPHVHGDKICLDILSDYSSHFSGRLWSSGYSVQAILAQLQTFLLDVTELKSEHLEQVPGAVRRSREYSCSVCGHGPSSMWPEMVEASSLNASAADVVRSNSVDGGELVCFASGTSFDTDILGILVSSHGRQLKIGLGVLSRSAFDAGVRSSPYTPDITFSHFLPLYLTPDHGQRALRATQLTLRVLSGPNQPRNWSWRFAARALPRCLRSLAVAFFTGDTHASESCLVEFLGIARWLVHFADTSPQLAADLDSRVSSFVRSAKGRSRSAVPDLGDFVCYMLAARSLDLSAVIPALVREVLARNVRWAKGAKDPTHVFDACKVSFRTVAFLVSGLLFTLVPFPAQQLDSRAGSPLASQLAGLQQSAKECAKISSFREWYESLRLRAPERMDLEWDRAVRESQRTAS